MSKALKYLIDSRPQAMEAYFSFLRSNGDSLDSRTRALISIITKVINQTDAGLRQYAKKAIADGITSDEILDAIMMAFPAIGLTKTVWAVDVLLECGVFEHDKPVSEEIGQWHDIRSTEGVSTPDIIECDGRSLFVSQDDDNWRIFDAKCSHHGATLAFCEINGSTVECPLHGWRFDVTNGDCIRFGMKGLQELKTKVSGTRLFAWW